MKDKYHDLLERSIWTAVQAFAGALIAMEITTEVEWDTTLYAAGIAALIAVAKSLVAFQFGDPNSAALPDAKEV
jgi:sugar phosphate permease